MEGIDPQQKLAVREDVNPHTQYRQWIICPEAGGMGLGVVSAPMDDPEACTAAATAAQMIADRRVIVRHLIV